MQERLGAALAELVDLDPHKVRAITIRCEAGHMPTVEAELIVPDRSEVLLAQGTMASMSWDTPEPPPSARKRAVKIEEKE